MHVYCAKFLAYAPRNIYYMYNISKYFTNIYTCIPTAVYLYAGYVSVYIISYCIYSYIPVLLSEPDKDTGVYQYVLSICILFFVVYNICLLVYVLQ